MRMGHSDSSLARQLAAFFHRNGYLRWVNPVRRKRAGREYKKGYEVRLIARSLDELRTMQHLLTTLEFRPGRPYEQAKRFRLPLYGKAAVIRFLNLVEADLPRGAKQRQASKHTKRG